MALNKNILGLIGNTPLVRINRMSPHGGAQIWAKLEGLNPGGSVKDRIALYMVEAAERDGALTPGGTIVEPTSGNTGIGLALVCAARGYRLILTMSEAMSMERRLLLQAYGAELVITPAEKGMLGAWDKAEEIRRRNPGYFMPLQFENPANPEAHRKTTASEILRDLQGAPDALVAGVGTGGTITGTGEVLRGSNPGILIVAVEPAGSPILSGGSPGRHRIAGIGAGFMPGILNTKIYDEVVTVTDDDAEETARRLAVTEGVLAGVSSGAAMWASRAIAQRLGTGKKVVVIFPDRGDRYLSTGVFSRQGAPCP
ncbi:MAG: cysteine synthase A [Nitrospirae bacterium]|nr:cysteine synthase A [Nitrospirota bacterium]